MGTLPTSGYVRVGGWRTDNVGQAVDAGLVWLGRPASRLHGCRQARHAHRRNRCRQLRLAQQHRLQVACPATCTAEQDIVRKGPQ